MFIDVHEDSRCRFRDPRGALKRRSSLIIAFDMTNTAIREVGCLINGRISSALRR